MNQELKKKNVLIKHKKCDISESYIYSLTMNASVIVALLVAVVAISVECAPPKPDLDATVGLPAPSKTFCYKMHKVQF